MRPHSNWFDEKLLLLIKDQQNNEEVKYIIEKQDLYNVTDSSKNTLLHKAVQSENTKIVKYLVCLGSKVNAQNLLAETPWMLAMVLQDNLDGKSALQIIDGSDKVTSETLSVLLPKLQSLCSSNKEEIAAKLIDANWLLQYVVGLKDSDLTRIILQCLCAAKIDLNRIVKAALREAMELVDIENVKVLLEYKANDNSIKDDGWEFFCYDYSAHDDLPKERFEILKVLLDRGGIIDYEMNNYQIFKYADGETIKLLLQSSLNKSANFYQCVALENLINNENPGTIEEIRGRGFNVNGCDECEQIPLIIATECASTRAMEVLLKEGADINAIGTEDYPAIFHAIAKDPKYEQCVQLLLERGANVQIEMAPPLRKTVLDSILHCEFFSLGNLVVAHLALQEILGTSITETTRTQINSCDRFKTHFESSKQQLSMKVYESTTLLDLLTVITDEKFEKYARNEDFVLKTQGAVDALSDYRYFRTILKRRLSKAQTASALKTVAARTISEIMGMTYDRFPLIADYIVSYLDHDDMKNLITVKTNIRQIFY